MIDRSANGSFNGKNFQTVAAISLILDHIHDFQKVKNEGPIEDIVIVLQNGHMILAQAKSSANGAANNALSNLGEGLETLVEHYIEYPNSEMIYITNIEKMLGQRTKVDDFVNGETIWFDQLSESNRKIIVRKEPQLDTSHFGIQFLKYVGKEGIFPEKEKWIRSKMKQKLKQFTYVGRVDYNRLFSSWLEHLAYNSGDREPYCTREDLTWDIIIEVVGHIGTEIYQESDTDYSDVIGNYSELIRSMSNHFPVFSRIESDYHWYIQDHGESESDAYDSSSVERYAQMTYEQYLDLVHDLDCSEKVKRKVIMLLIEIVLLRKDMINGVRKEMGI